MRRSLARTGVVAAAVLAWMSSASTARAQAWVSDVGDGTFALSTQYTRVMKHLFSVDVGGLVDPTSGYLLGPGNQAYYGDIVTLSNTVSGEYVPLKNLAVSGDATYITSRYKGRSPESPLDDGYYHGDLQDMSFGARYMMRSHSLVCTPSVDVRVPLTGYNTLGHVGAGPGLTSVTLGLNSGRSLTPFAPMAYAFLNYGRVVVENVGSHSLDRNQWSAGVGTFLSRALSVQTHFQYVDTVDGEDWWWADASHLQHRNVSAKTIYRRVGLSAGYTLTRHAGLALSWESTISGANVHATHSLTLGASWGFWKRRPL